MNIWLKVSRCLLTALAHPATLYLVRMILSGESVIRKGKTCVSYISFEDVTKEYQMGGEKVLAANGVSFEMEQGELAVVLGPSGAGKTTILNLLGGMDKVTSGKIVVGGPMNGSAICSVDDPIVKVSNAVLVFDEKRAVLPEASACINCGRCVEACPEQLIPSRLAKFSNNGLAEAFESWHGLECVECGSCSFVCPARRQLAQSIKTMKKQVLAAKRKK